jgi:adenosylcobinamide-phosphate synthase
MAGVATAAGFIAGGICDLILGDPRRWHPVAGFGQAASAMERRTYANSVPRGFAYVVACVTPVVALGVAADRVARKGSWSVVGLTALTTWTVLGGTGLDREASALAVELRRGDVAAARRRLPHLCGRDPSGLNASEIARAVVESVAENTSDAVVAPLVWGAIAGIPGLLGYRAINTLDAMIGYRSVRYDRFGRAAARLDDAANLLPARLTALLACGFAPIVGGSPAQAWRVWRRDGRQHPSPNAGHCEAAFAGALRVRLGGENRYGTEMESRPQLGDGPVPTHRDIDRSVRLSRVCAAAGLLAAAAVAARRPRRA